MYQSWGQWSRPPRGRPNADNFPMSPRGFPTRSTGCRPIDEAGPCAEGAKTPSGALGAYARRRQTKASPGTRLR
eukprot:3771594-Prymnesium_polylepis.1